MSQHVEFKVAYDGTALRDHAMDVRDLAPALLALGQLFDEANRILNGDKASVKLHVKAQGAGSFEILFDLYQTFGNQVAQFLTGDFVTSAINLKELILGCGICLFWLTKKLKGDKPKKLTDLGNGMIRVECEEETFEIPLKLLRLYQDFSVRTAVEEVLKPLNREGIDLFQIKEKGQMIETVTKDELKFFTAPPIAEEKINTTESEMAYSIISLAFKDDNKWRLYDGSSTINATIKDENFKSKVDHNLIAFAKGDILRCRIRVTSWRTGGMPPGLRTEYEVLEIKEHIPAARQLLLFGAEIGAKNERD